MTDLLPAGEPRLSESLESVQLESATESPTHQPENEESEERDEQKGLPDDVGLASVAEELEDIPIETPNEKNHTEDFDSQSSVSQDISIEILNVKTEKSDEIKEFPTLPSPTDLSQSRKKLYRSKRTNSLALSVSSVTTSGQPTLSSAVFIKKAMESISSHKGTRKNQPLQVAVAKAIGE